MDDNKQSRLPLAELNDSRVREIWMSGSEDHRAILVSALQARMNSRKSTGTDNYVVDRPVTGGSTAESELSLLRFRYTNSWKLFRNISALAILLSIGWFGGITKLNSEMASAASIYTTSNGERATVELPDGSVVILNVGSRLEVAGNYASEKRSVKLSGEAMFSVKHHSRHPFTVSVGNTTAEVLGTRFTARNYPGDTSTVIAVQDGRVAVKKVVVAAGEQAIVSHTGLISTLAVDNRQFSFSSGILTIKGQSLVNAIPELNRWYNVDIRLGSSELNELRVIGEFASGSISDLAEILESTFDVRVNRVGRILTLYSKVQ